MTAFAHGLIKWLSSAENPPVRYLTARDLTRPKPASAQLAKLRANLWNWEPIRQIVALQHKDGSFGHDKKPADARATFWALCLLERCGFDITDEPVARAVEYLKQYCATTGELSIRGGGSGVLSCYLGVITATLIKMGALDDEMVQSSVRWLIGHQRFDHKATRAGGDLQWPYRAPVNYGCWEMVSCYHGVAGAFRALAAIPPKKRSPEVHQRLDEALDYLRIHNLYKRSKADRPLFRHMTEPFLIGEYRSDLLDMLQGIADADPRLIRESWVAAAADDMDRLTNGGRVTLTKNYGRALMSPIPLEPVGQPSRFLTYQWLRIRSTFASAA